jgi:arsenate reductase-like glutaredoxin family protein
MNVTLESPPPQKNSSETILYHRSCAAQTVGEVSQDVGNSAKRRLSDLPQAGHLSFEYQAGAVNLRSTDNIDSPSSGCLENIHINQLQKRTRYHVNQGLGQEGCGSSRGIRLRNIQHSETLFKALKALFPGMSDETIAHVLEECGEDVDAAIRRLNELQLTSRGKERNDLGSAKDEDHQHDNKVPHGGEDVVVKEEWVDVLVQQMSQASDLGDAKRRAAEVLQGIMIHGNRTISEHTEAVQKENALLKRAVAIQNSKICELGEKCKGVEELLRKFEEVKERCQALEMHNYSLQVHLKQATSQQHGPEGNRQNNPDVY